MKKKFFIPCYFSRPSTAPGRKIFSRDGEIQVNQKWEGYLLIINSFSQHPFCYKCRGILPHYPESSYQSTFQKILQIADAMKEGMNRRN